jgi:TPR repeat protein
MYPMGSVVGPIAGGSGTDADAAAANAALIAANLAAAADPDAVFARGVVYATGAGATHDAQRARECFERAAALGHAEAAFKLASMYESGGGGVKQHWGQVARVALRAVHG